MNAVSYLALIPLALSTALGVTHYSHLASVGYGCWLPYHASRLSRFTLNIVSSVEKVLNETTFACDIKYRRRSKLKPDAPRFFTAFLKHLTYRLMALSLQAQPKQLIEQLPTSRLCSGDEQRRGYGHF